MTASKHPWGKASERLIHPLTIAGIWFAFTLFVMLWVLGPDSKTFVTPDESVVRFASELIAKQGNPQLAIPFADVEDLAHPRAWLSLGNTAIPVYAPVSLYLYGYLLKLGRLGVLLVSLLPALSVGAFAAGTAWLLPPSRRALAFFAPALGFISWYWLMRPWMNMSPMLACSSFALCFWALWRRDRRIGWLIASNVALGLAAAIRPDYAAFLLLVAAALMLAAEPACWKWLLPALFGAGVIALVPNLILNRALTGHAFRAAYQLAVDRQYGDGGAQGAAGGGFLSRAFEIVGLLLVPMGLPSASVALAQFKQYFVFLLPVPALLLAQASLLPLTLRRPAFARALYASIAVLVVFFVLGRLHGELFGGNLRRGEMSHSVPRYLSIVFLFAALPPLLYLGSVKRRVILYAGALLLSVMSVWSVYSVIEGLLVIRSWVAQTERTMPELVREIPVDALVYTSGLDKVLWSHFRVGSFGSPQETATSMRRALDANEPVFVLEPVSSRLRPVLAAARSNGLVASSVNTRRGLYRISLR